MSNETSSVADLYTLSSAIANVAVNQLGLIARKDEADIDDAITANSNLLKALCKKTEDILING